jgi:hypothetical protein
MAIVPLFTYIGGSLGDGPRRSHRRQLVSLDSGVLETMMVGPETGVLSISVGIVSISKGETR